METQKVNSVIPTDPGNVLEDDSLVDLTAKDTIADQYQAMLNEIRSWGLWMTVMGVISLVASSFLDAAWGILLILVGLASFVIKDAAMFVVYGVALSWAALSNALGGLGGDWVWVGFGLFQVYMTVRVFQNYGQFRQAQRDWFALPGLRESTPPVQAASIFPVAGCVISALAVFGVLGLFVALIFVLGVQEAESLPNAWLFALDLVVNFAVLGLGLSLAALLSSFRMKILAIVSLITSSLVLLLFVGLMLLPA